MVLGQYEETLDYGQYGGAGIGINLLCGIAATIIISRKGHGGYQIAMHLLFGVFCCGIGSLISALAARDLARERKDGEVAEQIRLMKVRARDAAQQTSSAGQLRCPRCGSMNASELVTCWHCGLDLIVEEAEADVAKSSGKRSPEPQQIKDGHNAILAKLEEKLRIECKACGKQMQGQKTKVQSLKRCPKCGAAPFDYRQLPKA